MFTFFDFQIVKELIFKVFKKSFYGNNLKSTRTLSILKESVGFLEKRLTIFLRIHRSDLFQRSNVLAKHNSVLTRF